MGKNAMNLTQKELEAIQDVWESMKDLADSLLQEHKWTNNQMAECLRNIANTYEQ
tara:strand:- start:700 stop:864 length:165 start_codon:yes stop_codon:yes gene_type:complete